MSIRRYFASSLRHLFLALLLAQIPFNALAADDMEGLLPPGSCGNGWTIEGKPACYDRDTLSDRIDGEAELYFPYGFDRMAAARYAPEKSVGTGMDVEVYRMGSLLDAFGVYANYRQKDGLSLAVGAEASLSGPQIFFYQGRHFVHIQVTGTDTVNPDALGECARKVAARLPGNEDRPTELSVFNRPEIVRGTERYLPQSLLGYDFLNRGIMADATVDGTPLQAFLLLGTTTEAASTSFERYRGQLIQGRIEPAGKDASFLTGNDPLYGPVIVLKKGNCLACALKFNETKGVGALLESLCR